MVVNGFDHGAKIAAILGAYQPVNESALSVGYLYALVVLIANPHRINAEEPIRLDLHEFVVVPIDSIDTRIFAVPLSRTPGFGSEHVYSAWDLLCKSVIMHCGPVTYRGWLHKVHCNFELMQWFWCCEQRRCKSVRTSLEPSYPSSSFKMVESLPHVILRQAKLGRILPSLLNSDDASMLSAQVAQKLQTCRCLVVSLVLGHRSNFSNQYTIIAKLIAIIVHTFEIF